MHMVVQRTKLSLADDELMQMSWGREFRAKDPVQVSFPPRHLRFILLTPVLCVVAFSMCPFIDLSLRRQYSHDQMLDLSETLGLKMGLKSISTRD